MNSMFLSLELFCLKHLLLVSWDISWPSWNTHHHSQVESHWLLNDAFLDNYWALEFSCCWGFQKCCNTSAASWTCACKHCWLGILWTSLGLHWINFDETCFQSSLLFAWKPACYSCFVSLSLSSAHWFLAVICFPGTSGPIRLENDSEEKSPGPSSTSIDGDEEEDADDDTRANNIGNGGKRMCLLDIKVVLWVVLQSLDFCVERYRPGTVEACLQMSTEIYQIFEPDHTLSAK